MSPQDYHTYTQLLVNLATNDSRILGLIVLGSTAGTHHQPDEWSDHDFWLVVEDDTQEAFHQDLSWIPHYDNIVMRFRETQHGWKVVFDDGHVLEYAIFSREELQVTRFHHYKVLVDKTDIHDVLSQLKSTFDLVGDPRDPLKTTQHILSLLTIGMGRYHRGEKISGMRFIKGHAIEHLTALIQMTVDSQNPHLIDDLNPSRRLEFTHPQWAVKLHPIIELPIPDAAQHILNIIVQLSDNIPDFPVAAIQTVQQVIRYTKS